MDFSPRILLSLALFSLFSANAAVVRVEVQERSDIGKAGYEQIIGKLHFEVDPKLSGNAIIADIELAPVNDAGKVCFSSDLRIWKPKDNTQSNGAAWFEIPNRGGKASLSEWIIKQGFTLVNVGWEFDVSADKLRIEVPEARNRNGSPIRGVVSAVFTPDKRANEQTLIDLTDYPPANIEGADSKLIVRNRAAFPEGKEVMRDAWRMEGNRIFLDGGFEPGKTYEVFYLAEGPKVAGLGYAAIRDAVAWLKNDPASLASVKHAYAFGSSQCGRFLRDFIYLGFNTDEQSRQAFDGVMSHVAGAGRLVLNQRWSTPRSVAGYYTASYPFADTAQKDPTSGQVEGILVNPRVKHAPKVFYTNMAAEYWGAGRVGALTHTTPDGKRDIALPENVRSYFFACTSHGPSSFPPTSQVKDSPLANPVNANAAVIALREAMHLWVSQGVEPPPSVYPKLSNSTLVAVTGVRWPKVPGMTAPNEVKAGNRVRNPLFPGGASQGTELPLLVPQVDADGNDLGGIRMPDVAVPLGTATGWVFRPVEYGSPHEFYLLRGAWVPFARTKAQRVAMNDLRPSLEERYASKDGYLSKVKQVLEQLNERRFLAREDIEPQHKQASERWDWIMQSADLSPANYRKILFLGNSITKHGPKADIDWSGNWGMAASAESKDYVHLFAEALAKKARAIPEMMVKNIADFERSYADYDFAKKQSEAIEFQADLIILAIGENVPALKGNEDKMKFQEAVAKLLATLKSKHAPTILVRSSFWANEAKDDALSGACATAGGVYVDISALSKDQKNYACSERSFKHAGVANHPGDAGMEAIADALMKALAE